MTPEELVRATTRLEPVPFVPEIALRTAADPYRLWEVTGEESPPFWAFPWAGGQGLARYLLDHPGVVAGKSVLDAASGSGLVAIAAAKAGARVVTATDIDPRALAVIAVNAAANRVNVTAGPLDLAAAAPFAAQASPAPDVRATTGTALTAGTARSAVAGLTAGGAAPEVVLAADIFYDRDVVPHAIEFARRAAGSGADVLLADPGRAFLPAGELIPVESYDVPVLRALEETEFKRVTVYRLRG